MLVAPSSTPACWSRAGSRAVRIEVGAFRAREPGRLQPDARAAADHEQGLSAERLGPGRPGEGSGGHGLLGLDGFDGVSKRLLQDALADGPEHEPERPPLEVLAVAYHNGVYVGPSVGPPREGVDVARITAPEIGVRGLHDHAVTIGPVVVEPFPDAPGAFGDVGVGRAAMVHLEIIVGAVAEELRPTGSEVDECREELLRRRGRGAVKMDRGHPSSLVIASLFAGPGPVAASPPAACSTRGRGRGRPGPTAPEAPAR